jgi:hypothetical protein
MKTLPYLLLLLLGVPALAQPLVRSPWTTQSVPANAQATAVTYSNAPFQGGGNGWTNWISPYGTNAYQVVQQTTQLSPNTNNSYNAIYNWSANEDVNQNLLSGVSPGWRSAFETRFWNQSTLHFQQEFHFFELTETNGQVRRLSDAFYDEINKTFNWTMSADTLSFGSLSNGVTKPAIVINNNNNTVPSATINVTGGSTYNVLFDASDNQPNIIQAQDSSSVEHTLLAWDANNKRINVDASGTVNFIGLGDELVFWHNSGIGSGAGLGYGNFAPHHVVTFGGGLGAGIDDPGAGNVRATNNITANGVPGFTGDGSGLTGLTATQLPYRAGTTNLASLSTSQVVVFTSAMANTSYAVSLNFDTALAASVVASATSKTVNGFTITLSAGISGGANVDYTAWPYR